MKLTHLSTKIRLCFLFVVFSVIHCSYAQSISTASRQAELSAFAGGSGNFTGLNSGKNLDITAGLDLTFLRFRYLRPAIEVRSSYPFYSGQVGGQKNILAGPKIEYPRGRLHPYANFLVGRGAIDYSNSGYIVGNIEYQVSNSFVYSPGIGVDYNLFRSFSAKADYQFQHWNTPTVIASGSIYPKVVTLGLVYTFKFNSR